MVIGTILGTAGRFLLRELPSLAIGFGLGGGLFGGDDTTVNIQPGANVGDINAQPTPSASQGVDFQTIALIGVLAFALTRK